MTKPPDVTGKKNGSLGMSLMEGLSEDLDGHFTIEAPIVLQLKYPLSMQLTLCDSRHYLRH